MATVLPLQQAGGTHARAPRRAGVRLALTTRGRRLVVALAFVLGLLVAAVGMLALDLPSAFAGSESGDTVTVTVQPGDTLSGYALERAPEGVPVSSYVAEVRVLNHLSTSRVTAGQSIELPTAAYAFR